MMDDLEWLKCAKLLENNSSQHQLSQLTPQYHGNVETTKLDGWPEEQKDEHALNEEHSEKETSGSPTHSRRQSWALPVFFNLFTNKKCFCIFYQANNLFLHQSYLKSPLPVKLTW